MILDLIILYVSLGMSLFIFGITLEKRYRSTKKETIYKTIPDIFWMFIAAIIFWPIVVIMLFSEDDIAV